MQSWFKLRRFPAVIHEFRNPLAHRASWFRFVADARQLPRALALHLGVRHGPGVHPAERPAHQIRQRQARRARLGVPLGTLRVAGADLHPNGASGAHGGPLPLWGSEGARPPASPSGGHAECGHGGVGWLSHVRVAQASPADASETLPRAAPNGGHRAVADKLLGISVASLTGVEDDGRPVTPWRWAARSATPPLSALPHTLRRPPIVDPGRSYGP